MAESGSSSGRIGPRKFPALSQEQINSLLSIKDLTRNLDHHDPSSHLAKILIPRVAGTEGHTVVKDYIVSTIQKLKWNVEEDTFLDDTPLGPKRFTNIIATKDPAAARRVIIAAHYDSKLFSDNPNQFVGATDSAVACAMILDLVEVLDPLLEARKARVEAGLEMDKETAETTLQLIFFDGEEAFTNWNATDSLYGARHLAEKWSATQIDPSTKSRALHDPFATELSTIEHLVLVDLLGAVDPIIRSHFPATGWLYDQMVDTEKRLGDGGFFLSSNNQLASDWKSWFLPRKGDEEVFVIDDDHMPFVRKGVPAFHVIAAPFPPVWHKLSDDASVLDMPTMRRWNMIFRVFFSEYLDLRPEEVALKLRHE